MQLGQGGYWHVSNAKTSLCSHGWTGNVVIVRRPTMETLQSLILTQLWLPHKIFCLWYNQWP
jgi:hypothetical protein